MKPTQEIITISDAVESAKSCLQELLDELQEWYDSLPENLQGGDKAGELENSH